MRPLRAKKSLLSLLPHAKAAKAAEFQCKLRCRWSSRWLRATENAKAKRNEDDDEDEYEYEYENENCLADGNYKPYTLNTKQENINTILRD